MDFDNKGNVCFQCLLVFLSMKVYSVPLTEWGVTTCIEWDMTSNTDNILHTDMLKQRSKKEHKFAVSLSHFE